ncbi:MAG: hypothetical protein HUU37_11290 [Bdellovibrionales bacterium]|nr:hypothetical protein [Bdellovibrionales bacterium]
MNEKKQVSLKGFLVDTLGLILKKKRYWLLFYWLVLVVVGVLLALSGNGHLLPALYIAI